MPHLVHYEHQSVNSYGAYRAFAPVHIARHARRMGLKEIREQRGLSQRDLAEMIHMDHSTVQRAEAQARTAKLVTYQKLAKALGVELVDLFTDERTATEIALLGAFRQLPESARERWVEILKMIHTPTPEAHEGKGPFETATDREDKP